MPRAISASMPPVRALLGRCGGWCATATAAANVAANVTTSTLGARARSFATAEPPIAKRGAKAGRLAAHAPPHSTTTAITTSTSTTKLPERRLKAPESLPHKCPPRLRVADGRVGALLARRTPSAEFVRLCTALAAESDVALLVATEPKVWNVALQNRLVQNDDDGARALLTLLHGFAAENTSETQWSDLLFTLLRQRSRLSSEHELEQLLDALRRKCGDDFVARLLVSMVNGCANIKMFDQARFLVLYFLRLDGRSALPPRVLGNLVSNMHTKRRYAHVISFVDELLSEARFPVADMQPQVWIALFRSCEPSGTDPSRFVPRVIEWFDALKVRPRGERPQFERVFGAAIQCCVVMQQQRLALRCYHAIADDESDGDQRVVVPDENIYVNVLKACRALHDTSHFHDVYRSMVSDRVARSAGYGSAIRLAHERHDVTFLEEVLQDAFATEQAMRGRWILQLPQYNDALGCFAETKAFELAKDLFARLLENPVLAPNHVTMVEMVENYREAPFSEVFELMELFVELQLAPNVHVFTSLLATCGRRRLINDALALLEAMKAQGVQPDVKTYTAIGFIYGTHGHLEGIVTVLAEMEANGVQTDQVFFDIVMDGLYATNGIDVCFSLFREMLGEGLRIPEGMYTSLIAIGTKAGLIERTVQIAYNMECDGMPLSSEQMLGLVRRCEAGSEVAEFVRTFLMLHQGREFDETGPRFSRGVYDELIQVLARFSQRDAIDKIKQLAARAGYHDIGATVPVIGKKE